ncbi:MAG: hypothetical protein A2664_00830 [Candidatus Taylorbacteria bacterium RIFCSPHIGHO2_01_FULL_46_22b]|uniref:Uncharacterized protein n=1 Tax=Candidatus Taylorbacteria bacterium RIFCSPHIGHO2_01_FULL_46_22b TaxID=1802301 RepID=A0A1G2M3U4_9BACT|nr:MAG: hypothetical protein A2664_00830 [Candidatus Taylorbacteria bacterium RIFCSPHIGHO2_01_FULL_46_22b]
MLSTPQIRDLIDRVCGQQTAIRDELGVKDGNELLWAELSDSIQHEIDCAGWPSTVVIKGRAAMEEWVEKIPALC